MELKPDAARAEEDESASLAAKHGGAPRTLTEHAPATMTGFDRTVPARGSNVASETSAANGSETASAQVEPAGALAHARSTPASRSSLLAAVPAEPTSTRIPTEPRRHGSSAELWVQVTLCVVVALLLLAVIALPKRGDARVENAPERAAYELFANLQKLRAAIGEYRLDHGFWPCASAAKTQRSTGASRDLVRELTAYSDLVGNTSDRPGSDHPFGPYFDAHLPANSILGIASVRMLGDSEEWPMTPDESTGWIYRPATGEVRANCRGAAPTSALRYYDL